MIDGDIVGDLDGRKVGSKDGTVVDISEVAKISQLFLTSKLILIHL